MRGSTYSGGSGRGSDSPRGGPSYGRGSRDISGGRATGRGMGTGSNQTHPIQKLLKQDVLYLTVVNMPSEEELAEAKELLDEAERNGLHGMDAIANGIATFLRRRRL